MKRSFQTVLRSKILRRILSGFVMVAAILSLGLVITNAEFESLNERFRRTERRMETRRVDAATADTFAELGLAMHAFSLLTHEKFHTKAGVT